MRETAVKGCSLLSNYRVMYEYIYIDLYIKGKRDSEKLYLKHKYGTPQLLSNFWHASSLDLAREVANKKLGNRHGIDNKLKFEVVLNSEDFTITCF